MHPLKACIPSLVNFQPWENLLKSFKVEYKITVFLGKSPNFFELFENFLVHCQEAVGMCKSVFNNFFVKPTIWSEEWKNVYDV